MGPLGNRLDSPYATMAIAPHRETNGAFADQVRESARECERETTARPSHYSLPLLSHSSLPLVSHSALILPLSTRNF